jgi:hypothetical protein
VYTARYELVLNIKNMFRLYRVKFGVNCTALSRLVTTAIRKDALLSIRLMVRNAARQQRLQPAASGLHAARRSCVCDPRVFSNAFNLCSPIRMKDNFCW